MKNAKLVNGMVEKVQPKYRKLLEESELEFYVLEEVYYVKADRHFNELGSWEDLEYFLECQLLDQ